MGRKAVNVINGIMEQEHEHIPLKRNRELKTKRMNLRLPPSIAAWFKKVVYAQDLSLNDAAIEAFKA